MRARVHGQLGAVHYGGARARGRAALFLQVMAIAAVPALLTLLVAGKVSVRIQFGDRPTLFPRAATPRVVRTSRTRDVSPAKYLVKTRSTISLNWQKQQSYLLHMRLICKIRNANGRSARRKREN